MSRPKSSKASEAPRPRAYPYAIAGVMLGGARHPPGAYVVPGVGIATNLAGTRRRASPAVLVFDRPGFDDYLGSIKAAAAAGSDASPLDLTDTIEGVVLPFGGPKVRLDRHLVELVEAAHGSTRAVVKWARSTRRVQTGPTSIFLAYAFARGRCVAVVAPMDASPARAARVRP